MSKKSHIFYGDITCQGKVKATGKDCTNGAYYRQEKRYLCGIHSDKKKRVILEKNTEAKNATRRDTLLTHEKSIRESAERNREQNKRGTVTCATMQMMKEVLLIEGYRNVFPNNKHQNRVDGFGCASLSPMRLGPVKHNEPGLPVALNIENYHQFSKVFANEVDQDGAPTQEFRERQRAAFLDPIPHRHKFDASVMKKLCDENRNQPLYSVHKTLEGEERRFTYVASRYFYCHFYEALAKQTEDFSKLRRYLEEGVNLRIVGYDGYQVSKDLYVHYIDPAKPFGHELVLYTLLVVQDPTQYPWNRYREEHPDLYRDMIVAHK